MSIELTLESSNASGPLTPARFAQVLAVRGKVGGALEARTPKATMRGQDLRVAIDLDLADGASVGFLLDFAGQGARVHGNARGPSAAALTWLFHVLAASLKCRLRDSLAAADIEPSPDAHRMAATAYLDGYEAGVKKARRAGTVDAAAFVAWLVDEELVALAGDAFDADVPMDDATALYEHLIESDAIDDVFVSERELSTLLVRFRARAAPSTG